MKTLLSLRLLVYRRPSIHRYTPIYTRFHNKSLLSNFTACFNEQRLIQIFEIWKQKASYEGIYHENTGLPHLFANMTFLIIFVFIYRNNGKPINLHTWELSCYNDVSLSLSLSFQPMAAQLSKKAALPLAKILAKTSCRSSKTGPRIIYIYRCKISPSKPTPYTLSYKSDLCEYSKN